MKKLFTIPFAMFIASLVLVSCSKDFNDEYDIESDSKIEKISLEM
ncbi:hypothetical protein [Mesonia maritima]|uniref:Uncharacterized protein n=1 Tax=Mesonia maritima TaxID=1793873 RepID=A0ABU1K2N4_9FLAO|nr:hypothetical protein [Mesonia maritima]MDR6299869.1 hypothetical protein [Mesonia maritima]